MRALVVLGASVLLVACTGGPAGGIFGLSGDGEPSSYEKPGTGRESPGSAEKTSSTTEKPPSGGENPGSHGGGGGAAGGGGGCPPCDQSFVCSGETTATQNGQTATQATDSSTTLKTTSAGCQTNDKQSVTVLTCDGKVVSNGQQVGTWSASGSGFTISATASDKGATVTINLTCTPGTPPPPPPPPPTGGSSGSSGGFDAGPPTTVDGG